MTTLSKSPDEDCIIKVWEKKQEDLLFNLTLGLKGPFQKGKIIFKIISDTVRFAILEEVATNIFNHGGLIGSKSTYNIIYNEEISADELSVNVPLHKNLIFRLRKAEYYPIEIKTEDYPTNADTLVVQRIDGYE